MTQPTVTLYGRAGCCLCDEAREVVERVRQRVGFEFEELDIEADDRLLRMYLERIPVVTVNGREMFDLFVDEAALETALRESKTARTPQ